VGKGEVTEAVFRNRFRLFAAEADGLLKAVGFV
jgi:hypothetical protein